MGNIELKIERSKEKEKEKEEEKRNWMEERANKAERAAENGRSKELYKFTKLIIGGAKKQSVGVKDKNGNIKTEKNDIMERWKEHFCEILNREDPDSPVTEEEIDNVEEIEEINIGRFTKEEVRTALKTHRMVRQQE